MATPLSADKFLTALKHRGLGVVEHGNWRTHNRNSKGPWGPVHGVLIHHTGSYSSETDMVRICRTGYHDLPGPLCHGVIDRSGTVHMVGYGRCNHAGMGDGRVLQAVTAERDVPHDQSVDTDGNAAFYGFECINNGSGQAWPKAQVAAMAEAAAAICKAHGWNEHSVIGHKEWQPGKVDPAGIDMDDFRTRVAKHLKDGGRGSGKGDGHSGGKPKPSPHPKYAPYPGPDYFHSGRRSALIRAMGKRLVAEGCNSYSGKPDDRWDEDARRSYAAWQLKCGRRGSDANGIPDKHSWAELRVPHHKPTDGSDNDQSSDKKEHRDRMPQALADVAERTAATYLQTFLGLVVSSGTDLLSISTWQAAAVSALPAGLSAVKATAGTVLGRSGTAAWLPTKRDPATPTG